MESSIYFWWKGAAPGKPRKRGKGERVHQMLTSLKEYILQVSFHQEVQANCKISSHSSFENPSTTTWPNFTSVISLIRFTRQLSSSFSVAYSIFSIFSLLISSTFDLLTSSRIFLRFPPVIDLVSFSMSLKSCLGRSFSDFCIWRMKERNRLMSNFFKWSCWDTGSTRFLWVWRGRSYIRLKDTFQLFSNIIASAEKRSQIGDPVKCELKILFASNLDFGWENRNSCKSSQFLSI